MLAMTKLIAAFCLAMASGAALAQTAPETTDGQPTVAAKPADNILYLDLSTGGRVTIQLLPDVAPHHVERIQTLARQGFYDGLLFHRVIEGFMAQTGDPKGDGSGGSPLPNLKAEFNSQLHVRGTVSMARAGDPDSANSQFFIMLMPNFKLDGNYTVFGRVTAGMEFVDAIARGEPPANPDFIVQASLASQNKPEPAAAPGQGAAGGKGITADALSKPMR